MRLKKITAVLCFATLALSSAIVDAQQSSGISANASDPRLLSLQAKVDGLFARGEYERAYFIYRKELVPLGDKYAQYMVGYLHLTGMGADEDPVLASAWYRLAAERGTPEFIALRDELMRALPPAQRQRSDALYMDLRRQYSSSTSASQQRNPNRRPPIRRSVCPETR